MIDHVTANVSDFEQAKQFYEQALAPLGYSVQMEFEGAAGFGTGEGVPDLWIGSSPERGATHVAFIGRASMPSSRRRSQRVERTTAPRACARTTTRATTQPTFMTPTATTSRRSATARSDPRPPRRHFEPQAASRRWSQPLRWPARTTAAGAGDEGRHGPLSNGRPRGRTDPAARPLHRRPEFVVGRTEPWSGVAPLAPCFSAWPPLSAELGWWATADSTPSAHAGRAL
jgi:hypothetical protein